MNLSAGTVVRMKAKTLFSMKSRMKACSVVRPNLHGESRSGARPVADAIPQVSFFGPVVHEQPTTPLQVFQLAH